MAKRSVLHENRHGLTKKEHWIFKFLIQKFVSKLGTHQGKVALYYPESGETKFRAPGDEVFYVLRAWSQWVEGDFGHARILVLCKNAGFEFVATVDGQPCEVRLPAGRSHVTRGDLAMLERHAPTWRERVANGDIVVGYEPENEVSVLCRKAGLKLVTSVDGWRQTITLPAGHSYVTPDDLAMLERHAPTWRERVAAGSIVVGYDPKSDRRRHDTPMGIFRRVELDFKAAIKSGRAPNAVSITNPDAISKYLSIWWIRSVLARQPSDDVELRVSRRAEPTTPDPPPLRPDRWALERAGIIGTWEVEQGNVDAGFRRMMVSGQDFNSMWAMTQHDRIMSGLASTSWAVLRAKGETGFISPDRPQDPRTAHDKPHIIPIGRNVALVADRKDQTMGDGAVREINRAMVQQAREFVFGHPSDIEALRVDLPVRPH